ncbi:MAG: hypothetical protein ACYDA3_13475 [Gaiellaceae bacterium]
MTKQRARDVNEDSEKLSPTLKALRESPHCRSIRPIEGATVIFLSPRALKAAKQTLKR